MADGFFLKVIFLCMKHNANAKLYIKRLGLLYLRPDRNFNLKTWVEHGEQFPKVFVVVLETMSENQVADDVGNDVVEDEVRAEAFAWDKNH